MYVAMSRYCKFAHVTFFCTQHLLTYLPSATSVSLGGVLSLRGGAFTSWLWNILIVLRNQDLPEVRIHGSFVNRSQVDPHLTLPKSTEFPTTGKLADGTYQMSGKTGSLRYMAPEVAKEQPYNETVDVYSLAIMAWQIFEMDTPFKGYSIAMHNNLVVEKGGRPKLNQKWGKAICQWLGDAWKVKISKRPSMKASTRVLREQISVLQDETEDATNLDASSRTAASAS